MRQCLEAVETAIVGTCSEWRRVQWSSSPSRLAVHVASTPAAPTRRVARARLSSTSWTWTTMTTTRNLVARPNRAQGISSRVRGFVFTVENGIGVVAWLRDGKRQEHPLKRVWNFCCQCFFSTVMVDTNDTNSSDEDYDEVPYLMSDEQWWVDRYNFLESRGISTTAPLPS